MSNVIEDIPMFNQISDLTHIKPMDSDNRLKTKHQEAISFTDNTVSQDSVSISSISKQLEALKESLRDEPEVNEARVLYFKAEIQLGNYQMNNDAIAMGMLNNVEMA